MSKTVIHTKTVTNTITYGLEKFKPKYIKKSDVFKLVNCDQKCDHMANTT